MEVKTQYVLKIGKKSYPVASFAQASAMCETARDKSGVGSRGWKNPAIFEDDKQVAYVSYNCRVWPGDRYVAGALPLWPTT